MDIGIIGAGAMGAGIAQVAALYGDRVILLDQTKAAAEKGQAMIRSGLDKMLAKEKISLQKYENTLGLIRATDDYGHLKDVSLCIEAVFENEEVKKNLYVRLEESVNRDCVIATNTSSLSVTRLASSLQQPSRFIGMHFFNPPALMPLVEIIPAIQTEQTVLKMAWDKAVDWGKTPVLAKDTPGFIVNKVARPYYSEAIRMYEERLATIEEIDAVMVKRGFRMGPFTLMDFIGHDVNFRVTESVWKGFFYDGRYTPSLTQQRLLDAGFLGKKSGKGFYTYTVDFSVSSVDLPAEKEEMIFMRIISMLVNEAADTVYLGICNEEDIEKAVTLGVNYPKGLMSWGRELGMERLVSQLDTLFAVYHEERYRVCPFLRNLVKN